MKFKLTEKSFEYLKNNFPNLISQNNEIEVKRGKGFIFINTNENIADEISEWAKDELQKRGFDADYRLNSVGKMLEEIMDAFFSIGRCPHPPK